jgi:acetyltransferase-like isoleucine patch superfamily enzyme/dTDP-4-dehydrorhamnose 3,5-epimerase-like enzyme
VTDTARVGDVLIPTPRAAAGALAPSAVAADPQPATVVHPTAAIDPAASLGTGVRVGAFVHVPATVTVGDNVVIEDAASFAGTAADGSSSDIVLREGCRIGAGAVLAAGVTIGAGAVVQPGSVVTMSVPSHAVVEGNPAKVINYLTTAMSSSTAVTATARPDGSPAIEQVSGVRVLRLKSVEDMRGTLTVGEFGAGLPFVPQRVFYVYDAPSSRLRGEHAHRECEQLLVCVRGSLHVLADDGQQRGEVVLDDPATALYLPPMVWGVQYRPSADALLLVLASHPYDPDDYIRDYDDYLCALADVAATGDSGR